MVANGASGGGDQDDSYSRQQFVRDYYETEDAAMVNTSSGCGGWWGGRHYASLNKAELIREYLAVEKAVNATEATYNLQVHHQQMNENDDGSPMVMLGNLDPTIMEKIRIFQQEIAVISEENVCLAAENARLMADNKRAGRRSDDDSSSSSSSSSDSDSSSSSESGSSSSSSSSSSSDSEE